MVFRDTSLPRARRDFAHWVCLTGHPRKARSFGDAQVNLVKESIDTKLESRGSFHGEVRQWKNFVWYDFMSGVPYAPQ
jgi:hypothetical protein